MIVGIIGCGNIGTEIAEYIDNSKFFELAYVCEVNNENYENLIKKIKRKPKRANIDELISKSELIIEAANRDIVKMIFGRNLIGKKIMVMSTGGMLDIKIPGKVEVFMPTGAISGLDSLKAVAGNIDELELISTKHPKGLSGAPYLIEKKINIDSIIKKQVIFEGNLNDAIKGFPSNINVAATLKLATGKEPKIKIIADPETKTNTHEIRASGEFGRFQFITENKPSKNPKTSYLAVLSALQCLKNIETNVKIGC